MKEFLSIKEVAEYLDVDYKTIYRLAMQGEIPAGKVGGVYRIRRREVEDYFERQQQALAQEAARWTQIKCGRCLRALLPHEVASLCEEPNCDEPLCHSCWGEDPDHRCRAHVLSREARLHQAQLQLERNLIPCLLTCEAAHRYEFLYLSRIEAELQHRQTLPNLLTGDSLRISDWSNARTYVEQLHHFQHVAVDSAKEDKTLRLPTNPRLGFQLTQGLMLEIVVYSDLATHLRLGFVTQPTSVSVLFELLSQAICRAEAESKMIVLALAATAGWERQAVDVVEGGGGKRSFYHHLVPLVLVDLTSDLLIYSHADERLDQIVDVFSTKSSLDVTQKVIGIVDNMMQAGRKGVLLSEIVEKTTISAADVSRAFEKMAATGAYRVQAADRQDRLLLRLQSKT